MSLWVDGNLPLLFEDYSGDTIAVLKDNDSAALNQLLNGNFVSVSAVFISDTGESEPHKFEFSLEGFISAYAQVDDCSS